MKPPGLNVPDMVVPDDMVDIKPMSIKCSTTGYTILKPFLYSQGREIDRVLGDGNCLYRAISKRFSGVEDHHPHLRKAISEFEADNVSHFKSLHEAVYQTDFSSHLKQIKKQYVWGTSTEIIAAATLLQTDIYVASDAYKAGAPTWLLYKPRALSLLDNGNTLSYTHKHIFPHNIECQYEWIEITHVSSIHFDAVKPIRGYSLTRPTLEGTDTDVSGIL